METDRDGSSATRYRVLVRYDGDEIRTHGWCAGVIAPRIEFVWRTVDSDQLAQLKANPRFILIQTVPLD